MNVIKSKFSSGKVPGAFATSEQFLWLPLEYVEWICTELQLQQPGLGTDGTKTNYLLTFRAPDCIFSWYIVCESREISGCHREAFISQLLVFGNDFSLNNFQNRATILPHDISFFFCCSCTASHQSSNLPKRVETKQVTFACFLSLWFGTGDGKVK